MSDLKGIEKIKFEKLFLMSQGYVLGFSNRSFADFVLEVANIEIYNNKYSEFGESKANRLRAFWKNESNYKVVELNRELMKVWKTQSQELGVELTKEEQELFVECKLILEKLSSNNSYEVDILVIDAEDADFNKLAKNMMESLEKDEPEVVLDRLHTYIMKMIRSLCTKHGIQFEKDKPLQSLFGEYIKKIKVDGIIESQMTERILKTSISILDSFNQVRNDNSYAHDNPILNYAESRLILKNILSLIEFLQSLEEKIELTQTDVKEHNFDDQLPF